MRKLLGLAACLCLFGCHGMRVVGLDGSEEVVIRWNWGKSKSEGAAEPTDVAVRTMASPAPDSEVACARNVTALLGTWTPQGYPAIDDGQSSSSVVYLEVGDVARNGPVAHPVMPALPTTPEQPQVVQVAASTPPVAVPPVRTEPPSDLMARLAEVVVPPGPDGQPIPATQPASSIAHLAEVVVPPGASETESPQPTPVGGPPTLVQQPSEPQQRLVPVPAAPQVAHSSMSPNSGVHRQGAIVAQPPMPQIHQMMPPSAPHQGAAMAQPTMVQTGPYGPQVVPQMQSQMPQPVHVAPSTPQVMGQAGPSGPQFIPQSQPQYLPPQMAQAPPVPPVMPMYQPARPVMQAAPRVQAGPYGPQYFSTMPPQYHHATQYPPPPSPPPSYAQPQMQYPAYAQAAPMRMAPMVPPPAYQHGPAAPVVRYAAPPSPQQPYHAPAMQQPVMQIPPMTRFVAVPQQYTQQPMMPTPAPMPPAPQYVSPAPAVQPYAAPRLVSQQPVVAYSQPATTPQMQDLAKVTAMNEAMQRELALQLYQRVHELKKKIEELRTQMKSAPQQSEERRRARAVTMEYANSVEQVANRANQLVPVSHTSPMPSLAPVPRTPTQSRPDAKGPPALSQTEINRLITQCLYDLKRDIRQINEKLQTED